MMVSNPDPKKVLADLEQMVDSDLVKARHYLKKGVQIAIIAGDDPQSEKLAKLYVELDVFVEKYQKATRRIVD